MASSLFETTYNPDVLTCLANLSNDEVFTPPNVVNDMLDMLPQELFNDPNAKFLDPVCKSGVFLREIAKRLIKGLEKKIPDLQERLDHIYKEQLFGIAITELTSLTSRRSLYCSKAPNRKYSVVRFKDIQGNIRFRSMEHRFEKGQCVYCGASEKTFGKKARPEGMESHAYEFIHTVKPEEIWDMKFDVIIGNPPYHLNDGGGVGASGGPIYNLFVEQAKKLNPRYLSMIIPSRWFAGGRELDQFRAEMLSDRRVRYLVDYPNAKDCFSGVEIKGGVCYFLWNRNEEGDCTIVTRDSSGIVQQSTRPLLEPGMSTMIRDARLIPILYKVRDRHEPKFSTIVSPNDPFGFDQRDKSSKNGMNRIKPKYVLKPFPGSLAFYYNGWQREGVGYIEKAQVKKGLALIDTYRVFIPKAWGTGNHSTDWLNGFVVNPGTVCTETYLNVGPFATKDEAENCLAFIHTRFFHVMVAMMKITHNAMQIVYTQVPLLPFDHKWTDEELFGRYGFSEEEIKYITELIPSPEKKNG